MTPFIQIQKLVDLPGNTTDYVIMESSFPYRDCTMWFVGALSAAGAVTATPVYVGDDVSQNVGVAVATSITAASASILKLFQQTVGEIAPATQHPPVGVKTFKYAIKLQNTTAAAERFSIHLAAVAAPTGG